jgi:hypothetical protein
MHFGMRFAVPSSLSTAILLKQSVQENAHATGNPQANQ